MKKIILLTILLTLSYFTFSQRVKYSDIIEFIKQKNYTKAYPLLLEYQEKKPDFANVYFQLGNISFFYTVNSNPILQKALTDYFIYQTKLFYGLNIAKLNAQTNDVRKNDDYYKTIPELTNIKKPENADVIAFVNNQIKTINKIDTAENLAIEYFNKFIFYYNEQITSYNNLLLKFNILNDIYIYPQDSILPISQKLISDFDSAQYYFNLYQKTEIYKYFKNITKQQLKIQPVAIYMLDGANRSNLLAKDIFIWDYKTWALNLQNYISDHINHFRQTISKTYTTLNNYQAKILNSNYSNLLIPYNLEQKIFFEVEKYDFNSLISDLFRYQESYIDLLVNSKQISNDTSRYNVDFSTRAKNFYSAIEKKEFSDSIIDVFASKINPKAYINHQKFFDSIFTNIQGLRNFVNSQKNQTKAIINQSAENLNYISLRDRLHIFSNIQTKHFNGVNVPMYIKPVSPLLAASNTIYTLMVSTYKNLTFVSGFQKTSNITNSYVALTGDTSIVWQTNIASKKNQAGVAVFAYSTGTWLISRDFDQKINTLYQFDLTGKQTAKIVLPQTQYPRILYFDEINNYMIIIYQGQNVNYFLDNSDSLIITKFKTDLQQNQWTKNILLKGKTENLIKYDTTFHLIINYNKISIDSINLESSTNTIADINFTENDNSLKVDNILKGQNIFCIDAYKINDHLLGLTTLKQNIQLYFTNYRNLKPEMPKMFDIEKKSIIFE